MITYELAKQLKDSGFPEKVVDIPKHNFDGQGCYPTLSELIDACGVRFHELIQCVPRELSPWRAKGIFDETITNVYGLTPEDAVARLWLELNKK